MVYACADGELPVLLLCSARGMEGDDLVGALVLAKWKGRVSSLTVYVQIRSKMAALIFISDLRVFDGPQSAAARAWRLSCGTGNGSFNFISL